MLNPTQKPKTLYDKIWEEHLIETTHDTEEIPLLYIDRHFIHEVTSPQAFSGIRNTKRKFRKPELSFATMDHNVSTRSRDFASAEELSRRQMEALIQNCKEFNIKLFDLNDANNGVVHVIGPELGLSLPGTTIVCGDSHTSTHGAFGALAFGIGTSEVEHVMATQTLAKKKSANMLVQINGELSLGVEAKDVILNIIGKIGTNGGQGHVIEYRGDIIDALSMEGRMTICNMSIEAGAVAGLIAADKITYDYLKDRRYAPKKAEWEKALSKWDTLKSDDNAFYDKKINLAGEDIEPQVSWGTNPAQISSIKGKVPHLREIENEGDRNSVKQALQYMDLKEGTSIEDIKIERVFIGSCTNGRLEDLRSVANTIKGKKVHSKVKAMIVPGSAQVKLKAEEEGLDQIFLAAGFEWRYAGCSMCLAMNDDVLQEGERCASTSNRNFEGRQGRGGRTHLVSPAMAAAAAVAGHFVDVRHFS